ncbi:MAG: hypothetical protein H6899_04360 [Rhodobacter sp.]|nr:hypothetical protein [Paracoccaceae bacterium]MCC0079181.1 hypothetical protein [Rhodobacter sp.]
MSRLKLAGWLVLLPMAAAAQDTVPYGSRAGMQVSVVARSGIDTADAVVRVVHTRADARSYCAHYVLDPSDRCVEDTMADLAGQLRDRIDGNCETGVFTDLWGTRMQFLGRMAQPTELGADWDLRVIEDTDAGPLDGSMASGYGVALDQFRALCPARLN